MKEFNLLTPLVLIDSIHRILALENKSLVNSKHPLTDPFNTALDSARKLELETLCHHLEQLGIKDDIGPFSFDALGRIQAKLRSCLGSIHLEAGKVTLAVLNDNATSDRFSKLDLSTLSESGKLFYSEAKQCLRIGAYRATIVNSWAMCMDFLQEWIVRNPDRLRQFNSKLAKYENKKTSRPIYSSINSKEDFWESAKCPSERIIIDCLFDDLGEKLHRKIVSALDDRNEFAHANSVVLELEKTNGYLSSILDILQHRKLT